MSRSARRDSLRSALRSALERLGLVFEVSSELPPPAAQGLQDPQIARRLRDSGVPLELFSPRPLQEPGQGPLQLLIPTPLPAGAQTAWLDRAWDLLRAHGLRLQVMAPLPGLELQNSPSARRSRLEAADLVLLPCWQEGSLVALVEAAAMAKPILCIEAPESETLIQHGRDGLLVPVDDPHALQLAVQLLVRQPAFAAGLGRQAHRKVVEAYRMADELDQTLATYRRLLPPPVA